MEKLLGQRVFPFSSARAGLVFGLRALGLSRLDEILIPAYLSHCVLSALSRVVMPALSPSKRTKAVLALDTYGFPQNLDDLLSEAEKKNWFIINDRAHSLYGNSLSDQDELKCAFEVFSLPKFFPCLLGGVLAAKNPAVEKRLDNEYSNLTAIHAKRANDAWLSLEKAHRNAFRGEFQLDVEGVFGYLPETIAFPDISLKYLPLSFDELKSDLQRRSSIWLQISRVFPDRVPKCPKQDIYPFAVPIHGNKNNLGYVSERLKIEVSVDVPVLHFDFALNQLAPVFKPALVIGCNSEWTESVVERTIRCLKKYLS